MDKNLTKRFSHEVFADDLSGYDEDIDEEPEKEVEEDE